VVSAALLCFALVAEVVEVVQKIMMKLVVAEAVVALPT
jgi:hypothetical protein